MPHSHVGRVAHIITALPWPAVSPDLSSILRRFDGTTPAPNQPVTVTQLGQTLVGI